MTQNHHRGTARPVFFRSEVMPGREPYPKQREQSRAGIAPEHPLRVAFAGEIKPLGDLRVPAHFGKTGILLAPIRVRSEEHTSELQSLAYLVCRLLLEKKKKK